MGIPTPVVHWLSHYRARPPFPPKSRGSRPRMEPRPGPLSFKFPPRPALWPMNRMAGQEQMQEASAAQDGILARRRPQPHAQGTAYQDLGPDLFDARAKERRKDRLSKRSADLGYAVELARLPNEQRPRTATTTSHARPAASMARATEQGHGRAGNRSPIQAPSQAGMPGNWRSPRERVFSRREGKPIPENIAVRVQSERRLVLMDCANSHAMVRTLLCVLSRTFETNGGLLPAAPYLILSPAVH